VAVCDQDDVLGFAVMHMRCLDFADLLNQFVEARRQLCRRSGRTLAENREASMASEATYSPPSQPSLQMSHS
jgi:hypothetical protein